MSDVQNLSETKSYEVRWVSQFPVNRPGKSKANFFRRLSNLVAGKPEKVSLSKPVAILAKDSVNFWVLDQGNNGITQVHKNMGSVPSFLKENQQLLSSLVGICKLPDNDILFTDSRLNKVFRARPGTQMMQSFSESVKLNQPTGVAYSSFANQIWVIETNSHQISIFDTSGLLLKKIGGRGKNPGEFNYPTSVWIDQNGIAYIVDAMNFRVQMFDHHGDFIIQFGQSGDASGYFARPKGIATDSKGHIYVADALFHTVQIFNANGVYLHSFGKQGRETGEFWMPSGIYIDDQDYIYVADSYNSRIQIYQLTHVK